MSINKAMIDHILLYISADTELENALANSIPDDGEYSPNDFHNWITEFDVNSGVV